MFGDSHEGVSDISEEGGEGGVQKVLQRRALTFLPGWAFCAAMEVASSVSDM